jgi:hypothetical protein
MDDSPASRLQYAPTRPTPHGALAPEQTPSEHAWPAGHLNPHPPQLLGSTAIHPQAGQPPSGATQSPSPVPEDRPRQVEPDGQALPHVPQLLGSCDVSTQVPWQHTPAPLEPLFPKGQALPSSPSAQVTEAHSFPVGKMQRSPEGHARGRVTSTTPPRYSMQAPVQKLLAHVLPVGQVPPQTVQLLGSLARSTHALPQHAPTLAPTGQGV